MKTLRNIAILFSLLFCAELAWGFTGTMVMIGGVAIRHIAFILAFCGLYAYFLAYLWTNKIKLFSLKPQTYFGEYTWIDWLAILFEVSMILSMTVIPMLKGTNMQYAHSEAFDSAAIFSLYFPVSFFIRKNEFDMGKLLNYLKYIVFGLSLIHIGFYFAQEADADFIYNFFDGINKLLGGNSIAPSITLGHGGYTRIIFTTSIYMIVGLYIFFEQLEKNTWLDYVVVSADVLAVMTTVTKSIWFGICAGFIVLLVLAIAFNVKNNLKYLKKMGVFCLLAIMIIFISDTTVFDHIITIRMENAFAVGDSKDTTSSSSKNKKNTKKYKTEKEKYMAELDKEGAEESNNIKLEQMKKLTEKWLKSPLFGWGYGSYVEGYLRSETSPFSYEMQLFALLMKIGIVGIGIWFLFFCAQAVLQIKYGKHRRNRFAAWVFLAVAMAVCVQTNPLLICFTGMSVILLISLISVQNVHDGMAEVKELYE